MNAETRKIYKKLGLEANMYSGSGGDHYKRFKFERFKDRLRVCLCLYTDCRNELENTIRTTLSQEEVSNLKTSHSPRELLTIFLGWENGEMSFISEGDRIQLIGIYKSAEYDFTEFVKSFRKKCKKQEEKSRVKNLLCLKTLETLIQERKIILE